MTPVLFAVLVSLAVSADPKAPLGAHLADLVLPEAVTGKPFKLAAETRGARATVLAFIDTSCPVCQNHLAGLNKLMAELGAKDLRVAGIYSHPGDTTAEVAAHARKMKLAFPVVRDEGGKWSRRLAVDRIPCVLVLDQGLIVRYRGRIDDQFAPGVARAKPTRRDLREAIDEVLGNQPVSIPWTETLGCLLTHADAKPPQTDAPTWTGGVASIIQRACQDCHRPGESAPFSLLSHADARDWSGMIREVVDNRRMPPWHAEAPAGHFSNERKLAEKDRQELLAWIDAGCQKGEGDDPKPREFTEGWRIGKPDLVAAMSKTVDVPAHFLLGLAGMPYQHVISDLTIDKDLWAEAIEVRPQNRAQIHHIIVYIILEGKKLPHLPGEVGDGLGSGMLATYVPGDMPVVYPPGLAKKIPKGSRLLFEVHYTPNGVPVTDRSCVGIRLATSPVRHQVKTRAIGNARFVIPAGDPNHEVRASRAFTKEAVILSLSPHMHLRGKDFAMNLAEPGKKPVPLLRVPRYDFNWQESYALAKPLRVPAGSRVDCVAHFDNSKGNPANPDPGKEVRWGDQTWNEMMIGFLDYYVP